MTNDRRKKSFDQAVGLLSAWTDGVGENKLVSSLLVSGSSPLAYKNDDSVDAQLVILAQELLSVMKGGTTIMPIGNQNSLHEKIKNFLSGEEVDKAATEKLISQFMRITFTGNDWGDQETTSFLNWSGTYDTSVTSFSEGTMYSMLVAGILDQANVAVNTSNMSPSPGTKKLYAIEMLNPRIGSHTRDTTPFGIFTSIISPIEMSRCVPYLNVSIGVSGSSGGINSAGDISGLSILSYINGMGKNISDFSESLMDSTIAFSRSETSDVSRTAGMEIFTSPQTMVSPLDSNAFNPTKGHERVLDRFRPFMSLKGLDISVTPTGGWFAYKSAKMSLTLHDRSRLAQVTQFVNASVYQKTILDIEYGWSHPFGNNVTRNATDNPMGAFLDGLRVREKYSVVNSSFSFDDSGQVEINLTLAMVGTPALKTTDISMANNQQLASFEEQLGEISKKIQELRGGSEKFKKLCDETILNAVSSTDSAFSLDAESWKEFKKSLDKLKKGGEANAELVKNIEKLLDPNKNSVSATIKKSSDKAVTDSLDAIGSGIEIFPCTDAQIGRNTAFTISALSAGNKTISDPISLGKLLLAFVGLPLANTGEYEEVHMIFHTFNEYASFVRDLSIAKFPISKQAVVKRIQDEFKQRTKVSCLEMARILLSDMVSSAIYAVPYGFNSLYEQKTENGKTTYVKKSASKKEDAQTKALADDAEAEAKALREAGIPSGKFTSPKLSLYPECVPVSGDERKSILRLHVVDEACSSFTTYHDLLKAARSGDITTFGIDNSPDHKLLTKAPETDAKTNAARRKAIIKELVDNGIVGPYKTSDDGTTGTVTIDAGKVLETKKSIDEVKRYVSTGLPTLLYGRSGGMINSIGVSSMNDAALATANMMRNAPEDGAKPDATKTRGIPMRIIPTEMTVDMMGMPTLQYMQQVFVDLKTGTTADNIYAITGIDHKIGLDGFTTSFKLVSPGDAYASYESPITKAGIAIESLKSILGIPEQSGQDSTGASKTAKKAGTRGSFLRKLVISTEQKAKLRGKVGLISKATVYSYTLMLELAPDGKTLRNSDSWIDNNQALTPSLRAGQSDSWYLVMEGLTKSSKYGYARVYNNLGASSSIGSSLVSSTLGSSKPGYGNMFSLYFAKTLEEDWKDVLT